MVACIGVAWASRWVSLHGAKEVESTIGSRGRDSHIQTHCEGRG